METEGGGSERERKEIGAEQGERGTTGKEGEH